MSTCSLCESVLLYPSIHPSFPIFFYFSIRSSSILSFIHSFIHSYFHSSTHLSVLPSIHLYFFIVLDNEQTPGSLTGFFVDKLLKSRLGLLQKDTEWNKQVQAYSWISQKKKRDRQTGNILVMLCEKRLGKKMPCKDWQCTVGLGERTKVGIGNLIKSFSVHNTMCGPSIVLLIFSMTHIK